MILRCAFINACNLFHPKSGAGRGPRNLRALKDKIFNSATTIRRLFDNGRLPDVIGLCEIHSLELVRQLIEALRPARFEAIWIAAPPGAPIATATGIAILYKPSQVAPVPATQTSGPLHLSARPKWLATHFKLLKHPSAATFWFVAAHWKSNRGIANYVEHLQAQSAREIGSIIQQSQTRGSGPTLILGDFNCEPSATAFKRPKNILRAVRDRQLVISGGRTLTYVYNLMWRHLGEADSWEVASSPGYKSPRPPGTFYRQGEWVTWDHAIVTRDLLLGTPIRLLEETLQIKTSYKNCSDHCAIRLELGY